MASGGTSIDQGYRGFVQNDTTCTGPKLRMKLVPGVTPPAVTIAGQADVDVGVSRNVSSGNGFGVAGDRVNIELATKQGTMGMQASGAISQGVYVYPDVSGQITATPYGKPIGIALEAASGAGSWIEVFRVGEQIEAGASTQVVTQETASRNVTTADFGKLLVAYSGSVEIDFTMPTPTAAMVGASVEFANAINQTMGILAKTSGDFVENGSASGASVKFSTSSHLIGARARAECIQTGSTTYQWLVTNMSDCTATYA